MDDAQSLFDEALRRQQRGDPDGAEPLYRNVLRLDPDHTGALYQCGTLELQRANFPRAVELLRRAAALRPDVAAVHNNLGVAYKEQGRWDAAAQAYQQALLVDAHFADAYFNTADLAETLGQVDAAVACHRQGIALQPEGVDARIHLGDLLLSHGRCAEAEECYADAIPILERQPGSDSLLVLMSKLGIVLIRQEKLEQALDLFRRMLAIDPSLAEMHANMAFVLERQGRAHEAVAAAEQAVAIKPTYVEGHNNLGVAWRALHQPVEARRAFAQAIRLKPDFALAQFNLGTLDLAQGNYAEGWPRYEWRNLTLPQPPRAFACPRWDGTSLPGKTLLVHSEQGYGDTLQFARFLKAARDRSQCRVILEGPRALQPLLSNIPGVDEYLVAGSSLPAFDAEVPLPSLPGVLRVQLAELPGRVPYIAADAGRRRVWQARLGRLAAAHSDQRLGLQRVLAGSPVRKIGIVWQGNPAQSQNPFRSCSLAAFARLTCIPGTVWFSLQKGPAEQHLAVADAPQSIIPLGASFQDFGDTAAAVSELDLIITVDTSVAHLAGALGRPTWTLLSYTPDWRWHFDREDSPWYPTMRLFRQPRWGDWESVFARIESELQK